MTQTHYWIKLYHEILHDAKMGKLSDHLWRRCIELFLIAGQYHQGGLLPPIEDLAWITHSTEAEIETVLGELSARKIVRQHEDGTWLIVNFAERQRRRTPAERMRLYRERQRSQQDCAVDPSAARPAPDLTSAEDPRTGPAEDPVGYPIRIRVKADPPNQAQSPARAETDPPGYIPVTKGNRGRYANRYREVADKDIDSDIDSESDPERDQGIEGEESDIINIPAENSQDNNNTTPLSLFYNKFGQDSLSETQRRILSSLTDKYGCDRLIKVINWAAEKDIPAKYAFGSVRTALSSWEEFARDRSPPGKNGDHPRTSGRRGGLYDQFLEEHPHGDP